MMKMEKMVYHSEKIYECADMVKASKPWTTKRKIDHWGTYDKLNEIFAYAEKNINSFLFDRDFWYFKEYRKMVFYMKDYTKKELDAKLKETLRYLTNELTGIMELIQNGEVEDTNSWTGN